jgi:hypothetical protein
MRRTLLAAGIVLLAIAGWLGVSHLTEPPRANSEQQSAPTCPETKPVTVGRIVVPAGPVAGFCQPQLIMAAHIMNAGRDLGVGTHTQSVGVMTAIGESGLVNLDHGDTAGPDSRGLFQQRDSGAWGTLADRMEPYTAASNFFAKLVTVDGWRTMPPSQLAHAVQVNADPGY